MKCKFNANAIGQAHFLSDIRKRCGIEININEMKLWPRVLGIYIEKLLIVFPF